MEKQKDFSVHEYNLGEIRKRKLWVPHMSDGAYVLAAVFRNAGLDSEVLPRSQDPSLSLGRKYTNGDQCLPSIITTDDILTRVFAEGFQRDKEAFFQGKSLGPCRFGRYYMNQELILHNLGFDDVPIFTIDNRNSYNGIGTDTKMLAYDGFVAHAMLERSLHFTRPFESQRGSSQEVYQAYLKRLCQVIEKGFSGKTSVSRRIGILMNQHKGELEELMGRASYDFSAIPSTQKRKPIIFVTGEIFVRANTVANQNLVEKIEQHGGVALLEPPVAFLDYVHENRLKDARNSMRNQPFRFFPSFLKTKLDIAVTRRDQHDIEGHFNFAGLPHDPHADVVVQRGAKYIDPSYDGETLVSLGASDFFADFVDGIVNTMPFNCLPGMMVSAKTEEFRAKKGGIPFLNMSYDGHPDPTRDDKLEVFMYQVKQKAAET